MTCFLIAPALSSHHVLEPNFGGLRQSVLGLETIGKLACVIAEERNPA